MERKQIARGQELANLLPTELTNLVMSCSKLAFLKKYAEHQAFIFKKANKQLGRGPVIICMDESSAMTCLKAESKAFCLAKLSVAKRQKRDLAIIPFASDLGQVMIFTKGQASVEQILIFNELFLSGGTNYEKPLQKALEILQQHRFTKADILFVTDGASFLPTAFTTHFHAVKKKKRFTCTAIAL